MERVLDKPIVFQWEGLPLERLSEWVSRRGVHGRQLTVAQFLMKQGYIVDRHSHPNEQITLVLRGAIRLDFETGESHVLRDGEFIVVPPNLVHWGIVLEDTLDFDAFSPPRSDWFQTSAETYYTTGNRQASVSFSETAPASVSPTLRVYRWDDLPSEVVGVGVERYSIRGQNETFNRLVLAEGAVYEEGADAERAIWVTEGLLRCLVEGGASMTLRAGECLLVPKERGLRGEALEPSTCLEVIASATFCLSC
jgi:quercetin dioxygenase-like cupin family protein